MIFLCVHSLKLKNVLKKNKINLVFSASIAFSSLFKYTLNFQFLSLIFSYFMLRIGNFPYTNLYESTNSVLIRHRFHSHIQKKYKKRIKLFYPINSIIKGPKSNSKIKGTINKTEIILTLLGILLIFSLISNICLSLKNSI